MEFPGGMAPMAPGNFSFLRQTAKRMLLPFEIVWRPPASNQATMSPSWTLLPTFWRLPQSRSGREAIGYGAVGAAKALAFLSKRELRIKAMQPQMRLLAEML
jgi:hypothetical protein